MTNEIKNLAEDLELTDVALSNFIDEMENQIKMLKEDDFDKFYKIADKVMIKYM
jgi:hypothetical protein